MCQQGTTQTIRQTASGVATTLVCKPAVTMIGRNSLSDMNLSEILSLDFCGLVCCKSYEFEIRDEP